MIYAVLKAATGAGLTMPKIWRGALVRREPRTPRFSIFYFLQGRTSFLISFRTDGTRKDLTEILGSVGNNETVLLREERRSFRAE